MSEREASRSKPKGLTARIANSISLSDALSSEYERLEGAIGLFYSPSVCAIGRLTKQKDEKLAVQTMQCRRKQWQLIDAMNLSAVFEARVFNDRADFRWLNTPGATGGRSVIVTEAEATSADSKIYDTLPQQYALWGEYDEDTESFPEEDWTIVSTSQVGKLAVPISSTERKDFVVLSTKEYLQADEDGNAYVKYERLLNFSWRSKSEN